MKVYSYIRNILFILSLLLINVLSFGQDTDIIRGTVIDSDTKETLIGITVVEIDKNERTLSGTATNLDGNYTLKLSGRKETRIRISGIGFVTKMIDYTGQKHLNISLVYDLITIDDVTVVAKAAISTDDGYMGIVKREQVNSISGLKVDEVSTIQATSIAEAIQGRIAGVDIAAASGDPGGGIRIQIRGTSSIMGDVEPLVIVDGLPYQTTSLKDFNFSTESVEEYSSLLDIPVENIMDIQMLKDAASAAIYGSKAANGVILITTKSGVKGKPQFKYNFKAAVKRQPDQIPLLDGNQYSTLMLDGMFNASNGLAFSKPKELSYDPNYKYYNEYSQNTDWVRAVTQTGVTQNHNLSISGGGENTRYFVSAAYTSEGGTTVGTSLDRISTIAKLDYIMTRKITVQSTFTYTHSYIKNNGSSVRSMAYKKAPNMSIYSFDDDGNLTDNYFSPQENYQGSGTKYYNPVAMVNESFGNTLSERLRTTLNAKYDITNDLKFTGYVVYDVNNKEVREFIPQEVYGSPFTSDLTNKMSHNNGKSYGFQGRGVISYKKKFAYSNFFSSMFGGDASKYPVTITGTMAGDANVTKNGTFKGSGSNAAASSLFDFFTANRLKSISTSEYLRRNISGTGALHLSMFGKYMLQATVRADGDSKFGQDKKWGVFPAFGVAVLLSEMGFLEHSESISFLKLRGSYGVNGRMPTNNDVFYSRYGADQSYYNYNGVELENIQLSSLQWEKTFQYDIGVESSFFKNRLSLEAEYYYKRTEDVIIPRISIPASTGFEVLEYANFGEILNKGWELNGSVLAVKKRDINVTFNFNVSNNINKVLSIPEGYEIASGSMNSNGSYLQKIEVGRPIGAFYGYKFNGVFARDEDNVILDDNNDIIYDNNGNPRRLRFGGSSGYVFVGGDAMYEDINRDGVIDKGDVVYLGNANPDLFGGFGLNMSYKGLYINPFFHFVVGQDVINITKMGLESMYSKDNQSTVVLRRWRKQGDETDIPRALYNKGYNFLGSDRYVEDASFMRLKTLSIGYKFNKQQLKRARIKDLNVYCNFYNLYTWTNYKGQDPEVNRNLGISFDSSGGVQFSGGKDNASTPPARNITFGLIIGF